MGVGATWRRCAIWQTEMVCCRDATLGDAGFPFVSGAGYRRRRRSAISPHLLQTSEFRLSVSPFAEVRFAGGFVFGDGKITAKNPTELQRMFAAHGANEVYARIATTQKYRIGNGDHSMERGSGARANGCGAEFAVQSGTGPVQYLW